MKLSATLPRLCARRGFTLNKLAKLSGVPQSTLHAWTTGRRSVNLVQLQKVAHILETSVYSLAFDEKDPHEADSNEVLKELFTGDVRVTIHRLQKLKPSN